MTHEFKPGDRAYLPVVVADAEPDRNGEIKVTGGRCRDDYWNFIAPAKLVRAIPTPDPLTELERRVVETAIARHIAYKECDASRANSGGYTRDVAIARAADSSARAYREAVDALLVAQAPKDPVQELREAWTDWHAGGDGHRTAYRRLERAITALESAR